MSDLDILEEFDTYYQSAWLAWDQFLPEADRDLRFYLGDQWNREEKRDLFEQGRNAYVFNRIRPVQNMIDGYQRKNRLSSIVHPVESNDQIPADQITKALLTEFKIHNYYQVISDGFSSSNKTGMNLMTLWMDYRDDPINGDIKMGREPYNGFLLDPYFTQKDLSDCNFIMRRKYLSPEMVASLLPKKYHKNIWEIYSMGWERDDKFTWLPYQRQPSNIDLMAYNEFYKQIWTEVPILVNRETGQFMDADGADEMQIEMALFENPMLEESTRQKKRIEKHIILNDVPIHKEINPMGLDEYPFALMICVFEPESDDWSLKVQSLTRPIIDPQREGNRRRSQMTDIMDSQINSGWLADENSVINPRSLFQAGQGKVVWRREDAKPGAVEKMPPAQIPAGAFQLQQLYDEDLNHIAGVNDAAFGQIESSHETGLLMQLKQGAAMTNLQPIFDNLHFTQIELTRKVIKLMQTWTPEKVGKIIGEEPDPSFFNPDLTRYHIAVEEGVQTSTQKQLYFQQLVQLQQMGLPVEGSDLLKAAPIQGAGKMLQEMEQREKQAAEQAQQAQQLQMQEWQAKMNQATSNAMANVAQAKERFTRAVANLGLEDERASEAVQNRAQASLDRAKAVKELEAMDDERMMKLFELFRFLEEHAKADEEEIKEEDVEISAEVSADQEMPESPQTDMQQAIEPGGQDAQQILQ